MAKNIMIARLDSRETRRICESFVFRATWDYIVAKDVEVDAVLEKEPEYNRSHMRVAQQVFGLLGKTDYRSVKELKRLSCHLIVTMSMLRIEKDDEFSQKMKAGNDWLIYMWGDSDRIGAHFLIVDSFEADDFILPEIERIDLWSDQYLLSDKSRGDK